MAEIDDWRKKIDEIDLKLVELLNRRSGFAIEIGKVKEMLEIEVYDPKREKQVVRNVQRAANGPLTKQAVKRLFERIIDESRRAEREARKTAGDATRKQHGPKTDRQRTSKRINKENEVQK